MIDQSTTHVLKLEIPLQKTAEMQPHADEVTQKLYADAAPSIVRVETSTGSGSGFFFDKDGHIATDAHVVNGESQVDIVTSSGRTLPARIEKLDDINDIAILKIDGVTPIGIKIPSLSDDEIKPDQHLWALGHPLGLSDTYISPGYFEFRATPEFDLVREGHEAVEKARKLISTMTPNEVADTKSALKREVIQAKLHVEGGNSGGPVINESGGVVGLADMTDESGNTVVTPIARLVALAKDSDPKFTFAYKYLPYDKTAPKAKTDGEYILIDRSRKDGDYRAPYEDQIFSGARWNNPADSQNSLGTPASSYPHGNLFKPLIYRTQ